ncbi:hypothetical protein D043_0769B, partial [Vibrio parahaemolyticus EKP-021]
SLDPMRLLTFTTNKRHT